MFSHSAQPGWSQRRFELIHVYASINRSVNVKHCVRLVFNDCQIGQSYKYSSDLKKTEGKRRWEEGGTGVRANAHPASAAARWAPTWSSPLGASEQHSSWQWHIYYLIGYSQASAVTSLPLSDSSILESSGASRSKRQKQQREDDVRGRRPVRFSEERLKVRRHLESVQVPSLPVTHVYI